MKNLNSNYKSLSYAEKGFTVVEVITVVVIMVIVATILTLTLVGQQKESRDTTRNSKATILAEALEKYYDKNGEYPSIPSLAGQNTTAVKQKLGLKDENILVFPGAANSQQVSIVSPSQTPSISEIVYAAEAEAGDSRQCLEDANGFCSKFQLRYKEETTEEIVSVDSRRNPYLKEEAVCTGSDCLGAPSKPNIVGTNLNSSTVRFTASNATCMYGAVQYKIRYNTAAASEASMPDWSTVNWSTSPTRDVSKSGAVDFYSQSQAQCVDGSSGGPVSASSDIHSLNFAQQPVSQPSVSAYGNSTSSIYVTWPNVTGSPTISYSVNYGTTSSTTSSSSCTSSPCTITGLNADTYYYIKVTASNSVSSSSGTSGATTISNSGGGGSNPVCSQAPSAPSVSASTASSSQITVSWSPSSTPAYCNSPSYTVSYGPGSYSSTACNGTSGSTCTLSGLSASTTYSIRVTPSNQYGNGSPGYSSATTSGGSTAPQLSINSAKITEYGNLLIRFSYSGTGGFSGSPSCSTTTLGGGNYECKTSVSNCTQSRSVSIVASNGGSDSSTASGASAVSSAASPYIKAEYPNGSTVGFRSDWAPVANATYYSIRVYKQDGTGGGYLREVADTQPTTTVSNLEKGYRYRITAAGANCAGIGPAGSATTSKLGG